MKSITYNIEKLLALPVRERRKIYNKLMESLPENKLAKEELDLLGIRWENHLKGKSKSYSSKEMWKKINSRTVKVK